MLPHMELLKPQQALADVQLMKGAVLERACVKFCAQNDEATSYACCNECHKALLADKLPAVALANDLHFGDVPDALSGLTPLELALCSPHRMSMMLVVLKRVAGGGTGQRMIKGNVCVYPQDLQGIIDHVLPLPLSDAADCIRIVFAGSERPNASQLRKFYRVRQAKVQNAIRWLLEHRKTGAYAKCKFSPERLRQLPIDGVPEEVLETVGNAREEDFDVAHSGYSADIESVLRQTASSTALAQPPMDIEPNVAGLTNDNQDDLVVCDLYGVVGGGAEDSMFNEHREKAAWLNVKASLQSQPEATESERREEPVLGSAKVQKCLALSDQRCSQRNRDRGLTDARNH
jgi:hypothetical protein